MVVAGAAQVIRYGKPQAASVLGQRLVGEPDAVLAQEIPVQRVVRERQLVQERCRQRAVGPGVDGQPGNGFPAWRGVVRLRAAASGCPGLAFGFAAARQRRAAKR